MLVRNLTIAGAILFLVIGFAFPWTKTPIVIALTFGIAALGVGVMVRAGQVSFGHAMYACIGGYTVAFLARAYPRLDGLVLIAGGVIASLVAAALIGMFIVRYRGIFFGMLNLAISMVLYSVIGKAYEISGGSDGIRVERPTLLGFDLERAPFEAALLVGVIAVAVTLGWLIQRYYKSAAGEALAGIKSNETRLEYLGLSARRILWNGYLASAGLVGFSGAVFGLMQGLVTPDMGYWVRSGEFVFISILGGAGHAMGAFLGAFVFELVKLFAGAFLPNAWHMLLGATLILVIVVLPNGIVGLLPQSSTKRREASVSKNTSAAAGVSAAPARATK